MNYTTLLRKIGSKQGGGGWTASEIEAVWRKGRATTSEVYRMDACNAFMQRDKHGDTTSQYGWEIDHIKAVANGGTDDISNLQPLQWENNRAKSDGPLVCVRR